MKGVAVGKKGKCCVCNEPTDAYCYSCAKPFGDFNPTYYCDKHYKTTVITGNCCRDNELIYS